MKRLPLLSINLFVGAKQYSVDIGPLRDSDMELLKDSPEQFLTRYIEPAVYSLSGSMQEDCKERI